MGSEPTQNGYPLQIRAPRLHLVRDDFALLICQFEVYARSMRIPNDKLLDALLDDAMFQAYDLLGLDRSVVRDFKQLMKPFPKDFHRPRLRRS